MTQQNNGLPRQNTPRNLAHFNGPFGILNIGGKREKASPRGEAFCFSLVAGSRLPATSYGPPATSYCSLFTVTAPEGVQFACLNPKQKFLEEGRRQANYATTPQGGLSSRVSRAALLSCPSNHPARPRPFVGTRVVPHASFLLAGCANDTLALGCPTQA
jgi:hypothetical protein